MKGNGHSKPTKREWANAGMEVDKYEGKEKDDIVLEIKKTFTKDGIVHSQSVIINLRQLAGLARDFLS